MREELIKSFLGFDVDGYILVNMDAAEQVVDAIGGVDFNVPPGMNYDDPTQDLHIHIPEVSRSLTVSSLYSSCASEAAMPAAIFSVSTCSTSFLWPLQVR